VRLGRRPVFFFVLTVICLVLVAPTPAEFRWVNYSMAGLAGLWAVLMAIESLTRGRGERGAGL
jgi:intracellular septation protein A